MANSQISVSCMFRRAGRSAVIFQLARGYTC
jgi:hypothetical protein